MKTGEEMIFSLHSTRLSKNQSALKLMYSITLNSERETLSLVQEHSTHTYSKDLYAIFSQSLVRELASFWYSIRH